jgi:branched-chain amino acid aminotransferase
VWLDAAEHRWVEEMGGMNIFFVYEEHLVTPPLSGTILPGVTRATVLELARDVGLTVEERPVSLEQWRAECHSGVMTEAFACGTAAVITSIGRVVTESGDIHVGETEGPIAKRLRRFLTDSQRGRVADRHGWRYQLVGPGEAKPVLGSRS